MEAPQYIFDHEPTVEEMRAAAVDLMRKALTVEWYTTIEFDTTTSVSHNIFLANKRYAGIPYNGPNTSLYAFLEYLDPETGRLKGEELTGGVNRDLSTAFDQALGSSCSGTVGWAILAVCSSVHGLFQSYYMVAQNGWLSLGDYTYDLSTPSFGKANSTETTDGILAKTGRQKMYQCYALLEPADILVWQNNEKMGHTMMAVSRATVIRNEDGSINGEKSYVLIQDQRFGGFTYTDPSTKRVYAAQGRVDFKYTFDRLFQEEYIPMTTAEFQGQKPYTAPEVRMKFGQKLDSPDDLKGAVVESNYPMATVALWAENRETGERVRLRLHCFTRDEISSGTAKAFEITTFQSALARGTRLKQGEYRITVEARTPNGQVFIPVEFDFSAS